MIIKLIGIFILMLCLLIILIWYFAASSESDNAVSVLKKWINGLDTNKCRCFYDNSYYLAGS